FLCAIRFGLPILPTGQMPYAVLSGVAGAFLIVLWWLCFSRAPWVDRLGAVVLMVAGVYATRAFVDVSISQGAMGFLLYVLAIPTLAVALVVWAAATRGLSDGVR